MATPGGGGYFEPVWGNEQVPNPVVPITAAAEKLTALQQILDARIRQCIALAQITQNTCEQCVREAVNQAISAAKNRYNVVADELNQLTAGLISRAWEIAAELGCVPPIPEEPHAEAAQAEDTLTSTFGIPPNQVPLQGSSTTYTSAAVPHGGLQTSGPGQAIPGRPNPVTTGAGAGGSFSNPVPGTQPPAGLSHTGQPSSPIPPPNVGFVPPTNAAPGPVPQTFSPQGTQFGTGAGGDFGAGGQPPAPQSGAPAPLNPPPPGGGQPPVRPFPAAPPPLFTPEPGLDPAGQPATPHKWYCWFRQITGQRVVGNRPPNELEDAYGWKANGPYDTLEEAEADCFTGNPTAPVVPPTPGMKPPGQSTKPGQTSGTDFSFLRDLWPKWQDLRACAAIDGAVEEARTLDVDSILFSIGLVDDDKKDTVPRWMQAITSAIAIHDVGSAGAVWNVILFGQSLKNANEDDWKLFDFVNAKRWSDFIRPLIRSSVRGVQASFNQSGCNVPALIAPAVFNIVLSVIERWTGADLEDARHTVKYLSNYLCPTHIPATAEAHELYAQGFIDADQWRCWVRANNDWDGPAELVRDSRVNRLNPETAIRLFFRGLLDKDSLVGYIGRDGIRDANIAEWLIELAKELPSVGDIIHFMVRNVYDEDIVQAFNLDAEFEQKFTGKLKEWAEGNGLKPEVTQAHWRAHWIIPAAGQLYEMFQRLRPDAVNTDVLYFLPDGKPNPAWKPGMITKDMVTSLEDVNRALGENDILPFWRARLLAISYRPLTRIDATRGYLSGAMPREALLRAYRDAGYSPENAESLAKIGDKRLLDSAAKSKPVKQYIAGGVSRSVALDLLTGLGYTDKIAEKVLKQAELDAEAVERTKCVDAVHKRYLVGDVTDATATTTLLGLGLDAIQAEGRIRLWRCEVSSRGKTLTASEMCKYLAEGTITPEEMQLRLVRIGYSQENAARVLASCATGISQKRAKAVAKQAAEEAKKIKQLQKDQATLEKQRANMAKANAAAKVKREKLIETVGKGLLKHVYKMSKAMGIDSVQIAERIRDALRSIPPDRGISENEWPAIVGAVASTPGDMGIDDIGGRVLEAADALDIVEEGE